MHIGLLEDDTSQIELISLWANEMQYKLTFYTTGKNFRNAMQDETFDLLILDWHLPDTTGIQELDWLRQKINVDTPVIFITSRDSEESVVEALDHGADDYMVKPVKKSITLARIKALQRRSVPNTSTNASDNSICDEQKNIENYSPYQVNSLEQTISLNGEVIKLTNKEFELVIYLFRNMGILVSRSYLMETIWGTKADLNTRTVDTHISKIRAKLQIKPSNGWQLNSIYQRGYRLSPLS